MTHRITVPVKPDETLAVLALDGALDGLWDWDLKSDRIYFNAQWKALLGYGESKLSDDPREWFSRVHQNDLGMVRKSLEGHIDGKTAHFRSEHRLQHADGSYRWFLVRGTALRNAKNEALRIAGMLSDINDRKQHELQLAQQLDELRFALASEKVLMDELDRKNKELTELSITDGLTGLYNHRHLQERFDYEFKRVRRYGGMLSCILIDIDHFKLLNDTYGHQYGDYVLRQIAFIIKSRSREVDICGRYGGEEFMVITNLQEKNALLYANKLHAAVQDLKFEHPSARVNVTVSIGVAEYNNNIRTKQELIERADQAMYMAKNDGRNLVRVWKECGLSDLSQLCRDEVATLRERLLDLSVQMYSVWVNSISRLVREGEDKDPDMAGHAENVSRYAVAIASQMKLTKEQIGVVRSGALLHDIGKTCLPGRLLRNRKKLSGKQLRIFNLHPEIGANLIREVKSLEKELPVILYHHERFDGTGFPHGLRGREIPIESRIVAVADAFDNMVSGRFTGNKITDDKACAMLVKGKKTAYCPDAVDALIATVKKTKGRYGSSEKKGGKEK